ncbi:MAG: prolipoprotein diacylglyceryl transferase [Desulfomonilaceae bacterium]|nr:prolipoprotein diacylglyceryl transferase [Desulfomonilaceae bacterium]
MWNGLFVVALAICLGLLLRWCFRALPNENWQILGCIPTSKQGPNLWKGLNITYYGLIVSAAVVAATATVFVLMGSIRIPIGTTALMLILILPVWALATKVVARLVEKKPHTFTIGGGTFVLLFITPASLWLTNVCLGSESGMQVPLLPFFAATAIAYTIGEGIGRLACISFGCCYGKPISQCGPLVRKMFGGHGFVFTGKTKKIAYESELDEHEVVPIQAITSSIHTVAGLAALVLYFNSAFYAALLVCVVTTQGWRAVSETLRADYRGEGKISAYQIMAGITILFVVVPSLLVDVQSVMQPDLMTGLTMLWNPPMMLALQGLGLGTFLFSGRSKVTESTVSFKVLVDRI